MDDIGKTKEQLIQEVTKLNLDIANLQDTVWGYQQKEKKWKYQKAHLESLIYYSTLAIVTLDESQTILACNHDFEKLFQYMEFEIIGKNLDEVVGGQKHLEEAKSYSKKTLRGEAVYGSGKRYRKEGTAIEVEFQGVPVIIEGKVVGAYGIYWDITDRKQKEEKIKMLSTVVEQSTEGMAIADLEGKLIFVNEAWCRMHGYKNPNELLGKSLAISHNQEQMENEVIPFNKKVIEYGAYSGEVGHITRDGKLFPTLMSTTLLKGEQGQPYAFAGVAKDITERNQTEEALRQQREIFYQILQNDPHGIALINKEGKYLYVNPQFTQITGYTIQDVPTGKEWFQKAYPDPEYRKIVIEAWKSEYTREGRGKDFEFKIRCQEGMVKDIEFRSIYLKDYSISVLTDVTQRKQAEVALRESERRLSALIDFFPEAILAIDENKRILIWNRATEEMTGIPAQEMIGKGDYAYTIPFYGFARPQLMDLFWEPEHEIAAKYPILKREGDNLVSEAFCPALYGGRGASIWAKASPLRDSEGRLIGAIECIRDISERKRTEEEKRKLEDQLQRAEKMEALGTLAGGVAHDLNNVLGVIVGFSELLLYDVEASSPLRPGLVNILDGSQRAAAIVQDLLTLARRGISDRQVLNLNRIITDCRNLSEFKNLSTYHSKVKIKTDLEPDLLNISGSAIHLSKTLFNLVSNASEAMPNGGNLTITTSNQYLDRPIQGYDEVREGDYVVLSVSDTGEGIPSPDLERIFEPFYTKKVMGRSGTGLGLAVVWGTIKDHHGYINVQSEKGKGSNFTLYFPVTREEITAEEVSIPLSEYLGKGEAILIVDDVKGQRDLAEKMLKKLNYSVTSVSSGEEAVAYLTEHKADLLVLDMIMDPGMDGLETYQRILEIHPHQKAIIVSGFSETERVNAAQSLGAGDYVRKPYVIEKLGLAVKKELDRTQ